MRFLFCSLDSPGFLYPSIGIARSLEARGHEVAFVTNRSRGDLLAGLGLKRISRGPRDGASFEVAQWGQPVSIAIQVKHIEYALASFPADVLIGQPLTYGPLLVAARSDLPLGIVGLCTYLWPTSDRDCTAAGDLDVSLSSSIADWRAWRHHGMIETLNKSRALFLLPPHERTCRDTPLLGDLFLLQSVPELEPAWEALPSRVHLVGSCLWEPEDGDPELDRWLADSAQRDRPLIYVQHGRSFHIPSFWSTLVRASETMGCRVVASVGRLDSEVGGTPESFFVRDHVSQGQVLRNANAIVASATTTAVLGALTAGVPGLLIPSGGEQPDVAALCRSAGIARTLLPEEVTPERIRTEISELLENATYRERARHCASAFARRNGTERATSLLEVLGKLRSPVLRDEGVPENTEAPVGNRIGMAASTLPVHRAEVAKIQGAAIP